jgi:hypothetical protein
MGKAVSPGTEGNCACLRNAKLPGLLVSPNVWLIRTTRDLVGARAFKSVGGVIGTRLGGNPISMMPNAVCIRDCRSVRTNGGRVREFVGHSGLPALDGLVCMKCRDNAADNPLSGCLDNTGIQGIDADVGRRACSRSLPLVVDSSGRRLVGHAHAVRSSPSSPRWTRACSCLLKPGGDSRRSEGRSRVGTPDGIYG